MTTMTREAEVMTNLGHGLTVSTAEAEKFHALPLAERERILDEFRDVFAGVFDSVDDYLTENRRENANED